MAEHPVADTVLRSCKTRKTETARQEELRELVDIEVADIVATGKEQGYSAKEILAPLKASVDASSEALGDAPDLPTAPPVGPETTPDAGMLEGPASRESEPGVG